MSLRRPWDPPPPLTQASVCLPPGTKGGAGHIRLQVRGWRSPNSNDRRKRLALLSTVQISAAFLKYQNGQLSGFLDGHMFKTGTVFNGQDRRRQERRVPLLLLRRRGQVSSSDPSVQSYSPSHSWPRGTHSPSSRHVNSSRPHSSEQV